MNSKRFTAFFIDFLITTIINNIPFLFLVILPASHSNDPMDPAEIMARTLVASFIAMLYLVFRDVPSCGSVGKMIMKLKIVDSETKGPVSVKRRILRNIPWLLNWIEIFTFVFTKKRIGDRIAKTDVISK